MKTRLAATQELVNANQPEARGFPEIAANENWPDIGYPGAYVPVPAWKIHISRASSRHIAALRAAAREEYHHGRAQLFAPVLLGAGAALWLVLDYSPALSGILAVLLVCAAGYAVNRYRRPVMAGFLGATALIAAGAALAAFEAIRSDTVLLEAPVTTDVTGLVLARETMGNGRYHYDIALQSTANPSLNRLPSTVSLLARGQAAPTDIGETIAGRARLTPPSGPAMPGLHDFALSAFFNGVGANGFFYGAPHRVHTAAPADAASAAQNLMNALHRLRANVGDRIRSVISGDEGAFAAALVTNEQRAISRETIDVLRLSGLAHIIAISGMNMALASGIFFVGLRSLLAFSVGVAHGLPVKKIAATGAILATTAYYMISGFAVSAERAYLMMIIILLAVLFDRPALSLRNIGLSALVILVMTPSAVLSASLQMSYAGTLGLVAGYEAWSRRHGKAGRRGGFRWPRPMRLFSRFVAGAVLTSAIGGASTALFSAEHFQRISTYGLIANVAAEPLISFIVMPAGFLAMLLMPFGLDRLPLLVMGYALKGVIAIGSYVSAWSGQWETGAIPGWYFTLMSLGFILLTLLRTRLRWLGLIVAGGGTIVLLLIPAQPRPDLVIAEDGRLAAFVTDLGLAPNQRHPPGFVFGQWQRALRIDQVLAPALLTPTTGDASNLRMDDMRDRYRPLTDEEEIAERVFLQEAIDVTPISRFACKRNAWCIAPLPGGGTFALLHNSIYTGVACDMASIVVTRSSRLLQRCRSGALLITRDHLRQTGALSLRLTADPARPEIMRSITNLDRPWERFRLYDWRRGAFREPDDLFNHTPEAGAPIPANNDPVTLGAIDATFAQW